MSEVSTLNVKRVADDLKEWGSDIGGYGLMEWGLLGACGAGACAAYYLGILLVVLATLVLMGGACAGYLYLRSRFASDEEQQG